MIRVRALSKRYMMYHRPLDRLWDWLGVGSARGRPFWALRDIDFEVTRGTSMGIVGVNGAGKSTLLKILTGTTLPTAGDFSIQGRVASLLELGTGFHPEFTGRQNIQFAARMAGLEDHQLAERFDQIVEFSELGDFIDQPVRTYSSGMALRLGFAVASSVDPDVLLIDEALAVGDLHFQQKCLRRIREFHERGITVLFVSHDPGMVKKFCTEAILLDEGRLVERGRPDRVLDFYTARLAEKHRGGGGRARTIRQTAEAGEAPSAAVPVSPAPTGSNEPPLLEPRGDRTGNFRAVITSVYLLDEEDRLLGAIASSGQWVRLCVRAVALEPIQEATIGIALKDRLGQEIYGTNTCLLEQTIEALEPGRRIEVRFDLPLNLIEGAYSVTAALHSGSAHTVDCYDWVEHALAIHLLPDPAERFTGICRLGARASVEVAPAAEAEQLYARRQRERLDPPPVQTGSAR